MNKIRIVLLAIACGASGVADAQRGEIGGVRYSIDNKFSVGAMMRTEDPDPQLVGIANGGEAFSTNYDDGNLAFDSAGDLVSAPIKLTSDLSMGWRDFSLFARATTGFNMALHDKALFDPNDYADDGSKEASTQELDRKLEAVRNEAMLYANLLDLYIQGNHSIGSHELAWRLGRQVINWGESGLFLNGLNSLLAANANRARATGFEVEEVIIPTNNAWVSVNLTPDISLDLFYQLEWERTIPDAVGTFFSTNDFVSIGGTRANIGFGRANENAPPNSPCDAPPFDGNNCVPYGSSIPRAPDNRPSDTGQFGGSLRFFLPWLGDADFGLYAANYHSRLPLISGISRTTSLDPTSTSRFLIEYPEDIQLYGASVAFSGPFGTAISGEYSLKADQPLQLDDVELLLAGLGAKNQITGNVPYPVSLGNQYIRGWRRHDVSQVDILVTKILGSVHWLRADQIVLLAEIAGTQVHSMPSPDELRYEAPGTPLPGDEATAAALGVPAESGQFATASSWGYKLLARLTYNNFLNRFTLEPTLRFDHDVSGITPSPIGNFVEGRQQISLSAGLDYLSRWRIDVGYTRYGGGGAQNLVADRDFIETSFKIAF